MLVPIIVLIVVIGVYPKPFLDRVEPAAEQVVRQLQACSVDPNVIESESLRNGPVPEPCAATIAGQGGGLGSREVAEVP